MAEAYIIDTVRTPRCIGKMGKGALSTMHPEHLSAAVLAAMRDRNNLNTAEVDDVIWGVSGAMGLQAGDIGRNAALDAGYDVKAGGVTLNRFCGSSITATNFAAGMIMSGMHDLSISGGMDMMSYVNWYGMEMHKAGLGGGGMGTKNPRFQAKHPQIEPGRLRRRDRRDGRDYPRGARSSSASKASAAPPWRSPKGASPSRPSWSRTTTAMSFSTTRNIRARTPPSKVSPS